MFFKKLFNQMKDFLHRQKVSRKMDYLTAQRGGDWSYLADERVFENVLNGKRVYCYEIKKVY